MKINQFTKGYMIGFATALFGCMAGLIFIALLLKAGLGL